MESVGCLLPSAFKSVTVKRNNIFYVLDSLFSSLLTKNIYGMAVKYNLGMYLKREINKLHC